MSIIEVQSNQDSSLSLKDARPSPTGALPRSKTEPIISLTHRSKTSTVTKPETHDVNPGLEDDPPESICQSPSWSEYKGTRRKKEKQLDKEKKELEKKRKKNDNKQRAADLKESKRLSKKPPPAAMDTQKMPAFLRRASSGPVPTEPQSGSSSKRSSMDGRRSSITSIASLFGIKSSSSKEQSPVAGPIAMPSASSLQSSPLEYHPIVSAIAPQLPQLGWDSRRSSASAQTLNPSLRENSYHRDLLNFSRQLDGVTSGDLHVSSNRSKRPSLASQMLDTPPPSRSGTLGELKVAEIEPQDFREAQSPNLDDQDDHKQRNPCLQHQRPHGESTSRLEDHLETKGDGACSRILSFDQKVPSHSTSLSTNETELDLTRRTAHPPILHDGISYVQKQRMKTQQRSISGYEDELAIEHATRAAVNSSQKIGDQYWPPTPNDSAESLENTNAQYNPTETLEAAQGRVQATGAEKLTTSMDDSEELHRDQFVRPSRASDSANPEATKRSQSEHLLRPVPRAALSSPTNSINSNKTVTFKESVTDMSKALVSKERTTGETLGSNSTPMTGEKQRSQAAQGSIGKRPSPCSRQWSEKSHHDTKREATQSPLSPKRAWRSPIGLPRSATTPNFTATAGANVQPPSLPAHSTRLGTSNGQQRLLAIMGPPVAKAPGPDNTIFETIVEGIDGDGLVRETSLKRPRSNPQIQFHETSSKLPSLDFLPELKHQSLTKPSKTSPTRPGSLYNTGNGVRGQALFNNPPIGTTTTSSDQTSPDSPYRSLSRSAQISFPRQTSDDSILPKAPFASPTFTRGPTPPRRSKPRLLAPASVPSSSSSISTASSSISFHPNDITNKHITNGGILAATPLFVTSTGKGNSLGPGLTKGILEAKPLAKMFVICCKCKYWHDLPSKLYEAMALPRKIGLDAVTQSVGASHSHSSPVNLGDIVGEKSNAKSKSHPTGQGSKGSDKSNEKTTPAPTLKEMKPGEAKVFTTVKCPWCEHGMSTACCAGWTAIVYMHERHH